LKHKTYKTILFILSISYLFFTLQNSFAKGDNMDKHDLVSKKKLQNGVVSIIKHSNRAPVVAVQVWVMAGSAYETPQQAGITHLIEHMIFKGTEKRKPGEIASSIETIGGSINAYTSLDYTVYHCEVPRDAARQAIDILADAVFHSTFDPVELEREKQVVLEEIKMREDRPTSRLSRIVMENAYTVHPYKRPVIGFEHTVNSFTRDDILAYMKQRYQPENIKVVIVGDIPVEQGHLLTEEFFGNISGAKQEQPKPQRETAQTALRLHVENMNIHEGYLAMAFSGLPPFDHEDTVALDLLATVLGEGTSSRLTKNLKDKKQLVHSISSYSFTPQGPGLFEITSSIEPKLATQVIIETVRELVLLQNELISDNELNRAKTQVEKGFISSRETMEGDAQKYGIFEALKGEPDAETVYIAKLRALTPKDIQNVAQKYMAVSNLTIAAVFPNDTKTSLNADELQQELVKQGLSPVPASDVQSVFAPVEKLSLSNGMTLLIRELPDVPTVAVKAVFPGGLRHESPETNGLFNYLARSWIKGTDKLSAHELADSIEGLGGSIEGFAGQNTFGLSAHFLSQHLDQSLALFTETLTSPAFLQSEVESLKSSMLAELKHQEDSLTSITLREFRRELYSPHPYSLNLVGSEPVFQKTTSSDLKRLYDTYCLPEKGVISIVGDVKSSDIIQKLENLLGNWKPAPVAVAAPQRPKPNPLNEPRIFKLKKEKEQTHVILGFPSASIDHPDRFSLEVLSAILAGQGGRLFTNLRDKESLAYSVTFTVGLGIEYGYAAFYIACSPEKTNDATKAFWREIYLLLENPVSQQEIDRAKAWLIGEHEIGLQTNASQALDIAINELYGLGYSFSEQYIQRIKDVTREDVHRIARTYLTPKNYVLIQVGS